jgi:multidrug resistance protein
MDSPQNETATAANARIDTDLEQRLPNRRMVTAALLVAMTVTAMEQLVVSPAMTTIIAQLRGFDIYPWVISAYLLAATVSTPIYGKLADLYGRKPILLFGLGLFSLGSILSGTSTSMGQLIAMRSIQGLGAGAVNPIVLTMIGDMFTLKERARVQGLFSAVWGLSSVAGPLIGGVLTDHVGWPWVFLVSVPFAFVAMYMLARYVHEPAIVRKVAPIDWAGAGLLTAALSSLLLLVLDGSRFGATGAILLFAGFVIFTILFVIREHHAADPILPIDLMTQRTIAASLTGSFLIGGILFGMETYVPLYIQGVRGQPATAAGFALTPLFLAWAVSVAVAARAVVRRGLRFAAIVGSGFITLGILGLVIGATYPGSTAPAFAIGLAVIGLGMGPASLAYILSIQQSVAWNQRGVATGAAIFVRTTGGAVGVGLLGALLGWELAHRLALVGGSAIDVTSALRVETHANLTADQLTLVQASLGHTLRDTYLQILALGAATMACSLWLPTKPPSPDPATASPPADTENSGMAMAISEA